MKRCEACGEEKEILWDGRFCGDCVLCDHCKNLTKLNKCTIRDLIIRSGFWRCESFAKK